jgi:CcmD family protein
MRRLVILMGFVATLVAANVVSVAAQDGELFSGVITGVEQNDAGELVSFSIVDNHGEAHEFSVSDDTEYGLENQAGDRWVALHVNEPVAAAERILDQQRRFVPVTVSVEGELAMSVVVTESGRLETNLGFLFAIYMVTWAAFFAYVFVMSGRQRDLSRQIEQLKELAGHRSGDS